MKGPIAAGAFGAYQIYRFTHVRPQGEALGVNRHISLRPLMHYPSRYRPSDPRFLLLRSSYVLGYGTREKIPLWVAERISHASEKGKATRKNKGFEPDPLLPYMWRMGNDDFAHSGFNRGHMASAGAHKNSERAQSDTFILSNVLPQDPQNNGCDWYRLELISRKLTDSYRDVFCVSGPLWLPANFSPKDAHEMARLSIEEDAHRFRYGKGPLIPKATDPPRAGTRSVSYTVCGRRQASAPTHLYKIILGINPREEAQKMFKGEGKELPVKVFDAFMVPNKPVWDMEESHTFQVPLEFIEVASGLDFSGLTNLLERWNPSTQKMLESVESVKRRLTSMMPGQKTPTNKPLDAGAFGAVPFVSSLFAAFLGRSRGLFAVDGEMVEEISGDRCETMRVFSLCKSSIGCDDKCPEKTDMRLYGWRLQGRIALCDTPQKLAEVWKSVQEKNLHQDFFMKKTYMEKLKQLDPAAHASLQAEIKSTKSEP